LGTPSRKKSDRDTRRAFTTTQKNEICDKQNNKCAKCGKPLLRSATHYDHKTPWEKGGKTEVKNGQALCATCHSIKNNKDRLKKVDKKRKSKSGDVSGYPEIF
jgi:5-methylcytosine-specific restriction endonuclease McrA